MSGVLLIDDFNEINPRLNAYAIEVLSSLTKKEYIKVIGGTVIVSSCACSLEDIEKQQQEFQVEDDVTRLIKSFDAPNLEQRMLGAEFYNTKMRNSKPRKCNNKKYVKRKKAKNGKR